jgi:hypothetical protein
VIFFAIEALSSSRSERARQDAPAATPAPHLE